MELSNFASIYCFITFIMGAVFMFIAICIVAMGRMKEPRNNVHFYVARDKDDVLWLYLNKPIRQHRGFTADSRGKMISCNIDSFRKAGLHKEDYKDLKWEDEPVEVFLNTED